MTSKNLSKYVIELHDVWKTYPMGDTEVHALRGLDIHIKRKEFVSIVGPSGSGKSTLMNLVGCLDLPSKGHVYLDGKDISSLHESDLAQIRGRKIGFIFQTFNLIPTLTAQENVALPLLFQGVPEPQRLRRAAELLKLVDLENRMHHRPGELSGGQRQRVAIARALANDPEVILADEPTGNLDSKTGETIMHYINKLHREEQKTIILVTHDAHLAKLGERVITLKDGKVASGGTA